MKTQWLPMQFKITSASCPTRRAVHTTRHFPRTISTMMCVASSILLLLLTNIALVQCVHLRVRNETTSWTTEHGRDLASAGETMTTSACGNIRGEPYKGMLTLSYEYLVEIRSEGSLDVAAIEKALVQAVVSSLYLCDTLDRPLFAVDLSASHNVATQGKGNTRKTCNCQLSHI